MEWKEIHKVIMPKGLCIICKTIGWRGCVAHARGCSGELNVTLSSYHAGLTSDIQLVIETVKKVTPKQLFIVGISLGGNAMLKFLGEQNPASTMVNAACAISVPFNLDLTSKHMNNGLNQRLYVPYFMNSLLPKMKQYAENFRKILAYIPKLKPWMNLMSYILCKCITSKCDGIL